MDAMDSKYFRPYGADGKLYGFVGVVTGALRPVGQAIIQELAVHGAACIYGMLATPSTRLMWTLSNPVGTIRRPPQPATEATFSEYASLVDAVGQDSPNTKIIGHAFNVAKEDGTLALIDEVLNSWGRLDVWVCSSGLLGPPSLEATTPGDLQRCFETDSMAPFFALKYGPPAMAKMTPKKANLNAAPKERGYGSIIVVSSVASTYGGCWGPCSTMSSHAALGVVRAGVAVLKGTGVRINYISPGQIDVAVDRKNFEMRGMSSAPTLQSTNNRGLERAGLAMKVGRAAEFLASGFSSYVTGANIDGGSWYGNP
ncbi:hypothetical protein B2J93_3943 [Marssonina coronariae]|uniref:Peroxisomal trans-2-enoyl-CoA reductase n=1 Tax=Diplocarpon coronariae TaxID=2795749 RepID=A0A218YYH5_9HELO|nr:hypothetical protein B2J93_3943 [Marssonina coronariae]